MNDSSNHAAEMLAAVGNEFHSSVVVSPELNDLNWSGLGNLYLRELAIEGFVNGAFLASGSVVKVGYRSQMIDKELTSAGVNRSDLKDLSRSSVLDERIDALSWAAPFSRTILAASSETPPPRHPVCGDISPADVSSRLADILRPCFGQVLQNAKGVLFPVRIIDELQISGFVGFKSSQFPVVLKPYLVLSDRTPIEDLALALCEDNRLLHPLWILAPGLGNFLVNRNREQLEESFMTYFASFKLLA